MNVATSSPSPISSTHSPTPYEQEPNGKPEIEAQYQNQESLGLMEPSYQNAAAIISNNNNNNNIEPGEGTSATVTPNTTATVTANMMNNNINNNIEDGMGQSQKNGMAETAAATIDASANTHLDNNSPNNISKSNINDNNQISNNQNLLKCNNINNNTDELYDIPVGEYRILPSFPTNSLSISISLTCQLYFNSFYIFLHISTC